MRIDRMMTQNLPPPTMRCLNAPGEERRLSMKRFLGWSFSTKSFPTRHRLTRKMMVDRPGATRWHPTTLRGSMKSMNGC